MLTRTLFFVSPFRRQLAASALVVAIALTAGSARAQAPSITYVAPSAVQVGKATDVTFYGANLAGVTGFWTNLPGKAVLAPGVKNNGKDKAKVTYRITVPAGAPLGMGAVRLATGKGVSNLRLMLVDDLASVLDGGKNQTRETAQALTLPIAVDGACDKERFDFYRFEAKADQRVSVEVYARRLGSALDPVIRLLDSSGNELAFSDDEGGISPDCRLAVKIPADGGYFIEVSDIRYQGGATFRYRLRVGNFPLMTTPYPLAVKRGSQAVLRATGPEADKVNPMAVYVPLDAGKTVSTAATLPGGQGSAIVNVVTSDLDEHLEMEPNDTLAQSTPLPLPCAVNGRFEKANDRDYFALAAKKGQRFVFQGQARSLGSPSDLFLRIYKPDGAKVAEAEDAGVEEGVITYTFPADGVYHLMVEDLLHRGGPHHVYRVEIRPYEPGFTLTLPASTFNAPQGGVFVAKVTAVRSGYNGPITLEVEGAPEGCQLAGNVIAAKKKDTTLRVTLPKNVTPGKLLALSIVGRAKIGDRDVAVRANHLLELRKSLAGLVYPPSNLLTSVGLGVGPEFPPFFELSLASKSVDFPQVIGAVTFQVKAKRLNKFPDAIALKVDGLPKGFKAVVKPIAKGKNDVQIQITGPADAAEGAHKISITGTATFQNQPKTVLLAEVPLNVVKPLAVAIAAPGAMIPGGKQKIKITLTRRGGEKGAVQVRLKNLPAGVSAPEKIEIPKDKNEVEIELTAAADAPAAKAENLLAVAATKIKGKDVTVESAPVAIIIKPAE